MADAILTLYLIDKLEIRKSKDGIQVSNEEEFWKRYQAHQAQALQKAMKQLEERLSDKDLDPKERARTKETIERLKSQNAHLYDDENGKFKGASGVVVSIKGMTEKVEQNKDYANKLYSHYFKLSQYEHFSGATKDLMNSQALIYDDFDRIIIYLHNLLLCQRTMVRLLHLEDKSYEQEMDELIARIESSIKKGITYIC